MVRSWGSDMVPYIFTFIFLFVKMSDIQVMIFPNMPRKIRDSSMER